MSLNIYLTIDDGPSQHTHEKVDYLKAQSIPAIWFARGEHIERYPDQLIYVIQNGFLVGNHSYSHPYFSHIPLDECVTEIESTEELIEQCYQKAGVQRPCKIMRFPFGDRGAGPLGVSAATSQEHQKVDALQLWLKNNGFVAVNNHKKSHSEFLDSPWDWDTFDYKSRLITDPHAYEALLQSTYETYRQPSAILLVHDFDHNHHLFNITMQFLQNTQCAFKALL